MPIQNRDDAVEVETQIASIFAAPPDGRANSIRRLFVETLDFDPASGQVSLAGASAPSTSSATVFDVKRSGERGSNGGFV